MNTLFFITVSLFLAWWTRNLYFRNLTSKYRYKLHQLRNELITKLILGEVSKDSDLFDFIDYSVSKSIQYLDCFNLYTMAFISIKAYKNQEFLDFKDDIAREIEEDKALHTIYAKLNHLTYEFIKKRFLVSFFALKMMVLYVVGSTILIKSMLYSFKNLAVIMKILPDEKPIPAFLRTHD